MKETLTRFKLVNQLNPNHKVFNLFKIEQCVTKVCDACEHACEILFVAVHMNLFFFVLADMLGFFGCLSIDPGFGILSHPALLVKGEGQQGGKGKGMGLTWVGWFVLVVLIVSLVSSTHFPHNVNI